LFTFKNSPPLLPPKAKAELEAKEKELADIKLERKKELEKKEKELVDIRLENVKLKETAAKSLQQHSRSEKNDLIAMKFFGCSREQLSEKSADESMTF
jgi:hypothetical protein